MDSAGLVWLAERLSANSTGGQQRLAYLGPEGTFSHEAALQVAPEGAELIPAAGVPTALAMVRRGEAEGAVVPIENSVEGGVNATLDSLASGDPLVIVAEMTVNIMFTLSAAPGTHPDLRSLKRIATHPHAWAQCRGWLAEHVGDPVHIPTTSTAEAAKLLATDPHPGFDAALSSQTSVDRYGLEVLAREVADNSHAVTRFVLVAPAGTIPPMTGADKTTVQATLPGNQAGALLNMLEQFSARGVNLSRIESRPAGGTFQSYAFSMDLEGHIFEHRIQQALTGLHRTCPEVRFLGSYPRADGQQQVVAPGTDEKAFLDAREWIREVVSGRTV